MYSKSKYIVGQISDGMGSQTAAVVFPETIPHVSMSRVFVQGSIRSAGFCHFSEEDVKVYGDSVGLKVKSNPEQDTRLVGRAMSHPNYIS